jgi:hypothetical protein
MCRRWNWLETDPYPQTTERIDALVFKSIVNKRIDCGN